MLNHHHTASERSIPRMVAALTLLGVGAVWWLTRALPDRTISSREQGDAPRPDVAPEVPDPAAPLWASVAGEEDPGAAVEPPPVVTPQDGRE